MINLKNNEQRKQWLRNYKDWGVWYVDEHIGATYYRYVFDNGAQLIVDEYITPKDGPVPEMTHRYYHLVGGPRPAGYNKWAHNSVYNRSANSETELIEFLKYIGKEQAKQE